jgi:hypothetical protein
VRALAAEERRSRHFAPTEETLIAYQAGELSDEAADQVRAHLAIDPEAARFVAELDQFLEDVQDESLHLSEHEAARGAAEVRRKALGGGSFLRPKFFQMAAGVLLVTTVVSVMWGFQRGAGDTDAGGGVSAHELRRPTSGTRSVAKPQEVQAQKGDDTLLLFLPLEPGMDHVTVSTEDGEVVDDAPEVRLQLESYSVQLSTGRYPTGTYVLRIIGTRVGRDGLEILQEYPFRVTYVDEVP